MSNTSGTSTPSPSSSGDPTSKGGARARRRGTRFVFIDTEATGLDHERHELTEVSWVVRFEDGRQEERCFFPAHTTDGADADALELTHYDEKIAPQAKTPANEWLTLFLEDARDAVLVGAVPDFDAKHLERMCRKLGLQPTWDHHLLDVETLAMPLISPGPEAPRSLAKTCAALGIPHDKDQAHGALYDALQAMRVFDKVWEILARLRAEDAPLPPPVSRDTPRSKPSPTEGTADPAGDETGEPAVGPANATGTSTATQTTALPGGGPPATPPPGPTSG
jgi:DNA polymerase III epsilon subunit-like protein